MGFLTTRGRRKIGTPSKNPRSRAQTRSGLFFHPQARPHPPFRNSKKVSARFTPHPLTNNEFRSESDTPATAAPPCHRRPLPRSTRRIRRSPEQACRSELSGASLPEQARRSKLEERARRSKLAVASSPGQACRIEELKRGLNFYADRRLEIWWWCEGGDLGSKRAQMRPKSRRPYLLQK